MLRPYQLAGAQWLLDRPRAALYWPMGLGKTATAIWAIRQLIDACVVRRVLVVGTSRIVMTVWPSEIARWSPGLTFDVVRGPGWRDRIRQTEADIILVTYDQLATRGVNGKVYPGLVDIWGAKWPYDMLILDESSKVKNSQSARWRALRKIIKRVDRVVELTGTPTGEGLEDLWAQIYLLDLGERLGRTLGAYRSRWFIKKMFGYRLAEGADTVIHKHLEDICLSLNAKDYIELPKVIHNMVKVQLPRAAKGVYTQLEKAMFVQLEGLLEGLTVTAVNSGVLTNKCLQAANGALYVDNPSEDCRWAPLHDAKLDALEDIVEEAAGAPVLVAYAYRSDVSRILARFKSRGVWCFDNSPEIEKAWNNREIPMLLVHPASVGYGLNLQYGGNILVWFGLTWSLTDRLQMDSRLPRVGQIEPVVIHYLVAKGTIDELVVQRWQTKRKVRDLLLDALELRKNCSKSSKGKQNLLSLGFHQ